MAEPPAGIIAGQKLVLFEWGVSSFFGWGVYGLNLLLAWAGRADLPAASLQPIDPAALDLDPLERAALQPALQRTAVIQSGLRALAGQSVQSANLVLRTLNNGLQPGRAAQDVSVRGSPQIGVAFLDNAAVPEDAAERLREYEFVVAGSSWNRDLLLAAGAPRVELVFQGVDISHFHPAPRRRLFGDRFVIFSGGKLEYRKGQDLVLRAFAAFAVRHKEAILLTAWASPWPDSARTFAAGGGTAPVLRADGSVDIQAWAASYGVPPKSLVDVGAVPNRSMPRILREADVALLPSRAEGGTNLVAMECLACGVPTILSDNTGHRDLLAGGSAIPLRTQKALVGEVYRGWGESDVDEIVAALEAIYAYRSGTAVCKASADWMANWSWAAKMDQLGDLVVPYMR